MHINKSSFLFLFLYILPLYPELDVMFQNVYFVTNSTADRKRNIYILIRIPKRTGGKKPRRL